MKFVSFTIVKVGNSADYCKLFLNYFKNIYKIAFYFWGWAIKKAASFQDAANDNLFFNNLIFPMEGKDMTKVGYFL